MIERLGPFGGCADADDAELAELGHGADQVEDDAFVDRAVVVQPVQHRDVDESDGVMPL